VFRSGSADPALPKIVMIFAIAAALTGAGAANAGPKADDKSWTITLGPADHESMDGKPRQVEVFDAVSCNPPNGRGAAPSISSDCEK